MVIRRLVLMLLVVVLAACQPAETELPTLVPVETEDTQAPTETPTETPIPSPTPSPTATPQMILGRFATDLAQIGYIRAFHAAPDAAPIDIYVEQSNLASNIEYGLATGRTNIIAGSYTLFVTERGVSPAERAITQTDFTIAAGQSLLVIFSGVQDALNVMVYEEATAPLGSGRSRINFIHAVALAPMVKGQLNAVDLSPLFDFGQQSGVIEVASVETTLGFATSEQTLVSETFSLQPRTNYTLILHGRSNDLSTLSLMMFDNLVAGESQVRTINLTQAGAVDVYLDGQLIAAALDYANSGDRHSVTDGSHQLDVKLAGTETLLLENLTLNFSADDPIALILMGDAAAIRVLAFAEDLTPVAPDQGRIAYINALAGTRTVYIGNDSSLRTDIGGIGYAQGSPYVPITLGANRIFWDDESGTTLEMFENVFIEGGHTYLYVLTGSEDAPLLFSEPVPIDGSLVNQPENDGTNLIMTPVPATRIRLINALQDGWSIDVVLDDQVLATGLAFGAGTGFMEIQPAMLPLVIRQTGIETPILQRNFPLLDHGHYTVVVYGPTFDLSLYPIPDAELFFDGMLSTVRLINVSLDETISFGLVDTAPTDANAAPLPLEGQTLLRPSVPLGANYLIREVFSQRHSGQASAINGLRDWIISDNRSHVIAQRFRSLMIEQGKHYDVVVVYRRDTDEIIGFMLPYPRE